MVFFFSAGAGDAAGDAASCAGLAAEPGLAAGALPAAPGRPHCAAFDGAGGGSLTTGAGAITSCVGAATGAIETAGSATIASRPLSAGAFAAAITPLAAGEEAVPPPRTATATPMAPAVSRTSPPPMAAATTAWFFTPGGLAANVLAMGAAVDVPPGTPGEDLSARTC